jgi:hypothetical protein
MNARLSETLRLAIESVEAAGGKYAIVGGIAVSAWARPRATRDVDLYTDLDASGRKTLKRELESRGFQVPAMEEELREFGVFRSKSSGGVFLDVFDSAGSLGAAVLAERREARLGKDRLWFVRATELAALKAFSDRPRDFDDLVSLLASGSVDGEKLDDWARMLDESLGSNEVSERVARAVNQAQR